MTDKEKLIALLTEFEAGFEVCPESPYQLWDQHDGEYVDSGVTESVVLTDINRSARVSFNKDGKYIPLWSH